jgi:hypothetical protein
MHSVLTLKSRWFMWLRLYFKWLIGKNGDRMFGNSELRIWSKWGGDSCITRVFVTVMCCTVLRRWNTL